MKPYLYAKWSTSSESCCNYTPTAGEDLDVMGAVAWACDTSLQMAERAKARPLAVSMQLQGAGQFGFRCCQDPSVVFSSFAWPCLADEILQAAPFGFPSAGGKAAAGAPEAALGAGC